MKKRPWILLLISLLYACSPNGLMRNGEKLEPAKALSLAIAQNEATATVFGMPGEAVKLNACDYVLSIQEIIEFLNAMANAHGKV